MQKNYIGKKFTLNNFVVNKNNLRAYNKIKILNTKIYNPVYIHGKNGTGKTHLLKAFIIDSSSSICKSKYITIANFTSLFSLSLRNKTISEFTQDFFNLDILCIDNFEDIDQKTITQEQLANTIEHLVNLDKIVLIASAKHYKKINLSKKLNSLLTCGETIKIKKE